MAPTKAKARAKQSRHLQDSRTGHEEHEEIRNEITEKDETEERLEKLIFGDEAGFLSSLKAPTARKDLVLRPESDGGVSGEEDDIEDVPDDELFFLDSAAGEVTERFVDDHREPPGCENCERLRRTILSAEESIFADYESSTRGYTQLQHGQSMRGREGKQPRAMAVMDLGLTLIYLWTMEARLSNHWQACFDLVASLSISEAILQARGESCALKS
jgi:hypothetical protein